MSSSTSPPGRGRAAVRRSKGANRAWIFLTPAVILFLSLYLTPVLYAVFQSLLKPAANATGFGPAQGPVFAGLDNYIGALTDDAFLMSFLRVFAIGAVQVPLMLAFSLSLALLLDSGRALGRRAFSLIFFLPYAIPGVIGALMWAFLVEPTLSPFSALASSFGFDLDLTLTAVIPFTIGNMIMWGLAGYNMVIIYAALQSIPRELFEAARLDGAGPFRIALQIKVPLVMPAITLTTIFAIIGMIQLYNEPVVLKNVSPNVDPSFSPLMSVYGAILTGDFAEAATRSIILAVVALGVSLLVLRVFNRKGGAFG